MSQLSLPPYDACCLAPLIYIHTYVKLLCLSAMLFFTPVDDYVISSVDEKQWPLEISHPNVLKRFITAIIFMCYCEYQFILRPFKPLSHGQGKVCLQLWVSDFKDNFYTSWLHFSFLFFFVVVVFFMYMLLPVVPNDCDELIFLTSRVMFVIFAVCTVFDMGSNERNIES